LLKDIQNITESVSHFTWFFERVNQFPTDGKLKFTTYELVSYEFAVDSGKIVRQETAPMLTADSLYVYGRVKKLNNGFYEMEVCHRVQGEVPNDGKVLFSVEPENRIRDKSYYAMVIKDGKCIAIKDVLLNACKYSSSRSKK
jgi:hypothetical protein